MDQLRAIQYFLKVAEMGSFTEAAHAFNVPASSVSRRVQDLEADLGVVLLHRTTRSVTLTELGTLFLENVSPALQQLEHAREIVRAQPKTVSGVIRISAMPAYGQYKLLPAIKELRRQYPDLVVDLDMTDQIASLAKNETDIAIRATSQPPERSVAKVLTSNEFRLVASPDYLDRHGVPNLVDEIRGHKTILYRASDRPAYWQARIGQNWVEIQGEMTFVSNVARELRLEALDGRGLALLPIWGIEEELRSGTLIDVTPKNAAMALTRDEGSTIYLLYNRPKYRLNKIKITVDFLVEHLRRNHHV
ncbi:MAG: LysR family transcriptional regulator [Pseudoruegeria sp.]